MYMNIGRGCVIAGMLMILHAGLGSAHHRANLRLSEQPYDGNITIVIFIFSHMISCFIYQTFTKFINLETDLFFFSHPM